MAEQAYAYVTLIPIAKGFQQGIAKELGGVEQLGGKAGKDFSKGFGQTADKLSTGIIASFAAVAAGAGLLLKSSIGEASTLEESLNAVSVAYGKSSEAIVKLGESAASRLGVTQSEFNASAVRFSAFAERVVGAGGDVAGFVDGITTRASDFASVFNIDVAEALQVFQSGLSGEAEPLKRFGINLLDSEVNAFALANGIGAVGTALTESEKVQARYGLLLESTAKTSGDFANTSDGLANSQRILKAEFTDLQASIGGALLPVMADLVNQVKDNLLPIFEQLGDWLDSPEGIQAIEDFGTAMSETVGFVVDVTTEVVKNFDAIVKIGGALLIAAVSWKAYRGAVALATGVQLLFNTAVSANPYVIAAAALVGIGVGMKMIYDEAIKVTPEVEKLRIETLKTENAFVTSATNGASAYRGIIPQLNQTRESVKAIGDQAQVTWNMIAGLPTAFRNPFKLPAGPSDLELEKVGQAQQNVIDSAASSVVSAPRSSGTNVRGQLQAAIKETRLAVRQAQKDYGKLVEEANDTFAERNDDILDSYNKSVARSNNAFTKRSADIVKNYSEAIAKATERRDSSMAKALKDYNQGIVDTNKRFAQEQESIIQKSMDRLRDGFKSAVSVNVASIFDSDAIAGSVDGLVETLRDKLAGSRNLLDNAAKLTSAGFSQTFVEQVVGAGTELGNELANSILTATPETVSELQSLFGQIETTSETGMDALAQTIYDKTGLATTALQGLYDQTFIDLATSLTEQKAAYIAQQATLTLEFNTAIADAEATRTEALAEANAALLEAIADAKLTRDEALLESQEALDKALQTAAQKFQDDITAIEKVFNTKVASMKSAIAGLSSSISDVMSRLSSAQSRASILTTQAANAISLRASTAPVFLAEGGLVTKATNAIVGEAGPEVVIPLNRFESMMGMSQQGKAVNYYAAPNQSIDSEQDLFQAMRRAKVVAGW